MSKRSWDEKKLKKVIAESRSYRQALLKLNLRGTGGNYAQINKYIKEYNIDISHFVGQGWNKGWKFDPRNIIPLKKILVRNSTYQSYKLKRRLFSEKIKEKKCEECGWSEQSEDGRLPLELHHINGDRNDNRLENLKILCPNCHSLKSTHRGRNISKNRHIQSPGGGTR